MRFLCPSCEEVLMVEGDCLGREGTCSYCHEDIIAPTSRYGKGVVINDFVIHQQIGRGGMGTVYLAHQLSLDRPVALKILEEEFSEVEEYVLNFVDEARAAARLIHPNIVQAYAVGEAEGVYFIAMEFVNGRSLEEILKEKGRIGTEVAVGHVMQIAIALDFAWETQELIHRDVKPDNIMVTDDRGVAKLADMGLAQLKNAVSPIEDDDTFVGTPFYVAPEVILGDPTDNRSDLYALGITLFELLTGAVPFDGESTVSLVSKHLTDDLPSARDYVDTIPLELCAIIEKAAAKDPDSRYFSGAELCEALVRATGVAIPSVNSSSSSGSTPQMKRWFCPKCHATNEMERDSCVACGASAYEPCPECGKNVRIGLRYCPHCNVDVDEERRASCRVKEELLGKLKSELQAGNYDQAGTRIKQLRETAARPSPPGFSGEFAGVLSELRHRLLDAERSAREAHDAVLMRNVIEQMALALDSDEAREKRRKFTLELSTLRNAVTRAESAMQRKCYSNAMFLLKDVFEWRGEEIGDRYERVFEEVNSGITERDELLSKLEKEIAEDTLSASKALDRATELTRFRFPEKLVAAKMNPGDRTAFERMSAIHEGIASKVKEAVRDRIKRDRWFNVISMDDRVKSIPGLTSIYLDNQLKTMIDQEVNRRYMRATGLEDDGRFSEAERAWDSLAAVGDEYLPIDKQRMAGMFPERIKVYTVRRRKKLLRRTVRPTLAAWLYVLVRLAAEFVSGYLQGRGITPADFRNIIMPVLAQFIVFALFLRYLRRGDTLAKKAILPGKVPSPFLAGSCILIALSPASRAAFDLCYAPTKYLFPEAFWSGSPVAVLFVTVLFVIGDFQISSHTGNSFSLFGFGVSWLAALALVVPFSRSFGSGAVFPFLALVHAAVFLCILIGRYFQCTRKTGKHEAETVYDQ